MVNKVKIKEVTGTVATARTRTPYDKHQAYDKHIVYLTQYDAIKPLRIVKKVKRG
jgi:hypothetical protein